MTILSILYFLPLLPAFYYAWRSRYLAEKTSDALSQIPTPILANDALTIFLQKKQMDEVQTIKSEDYMQNEYVSRDNKIYLSPDVFDSVDVYSNALALRAGAQAYCAKTRPYILNSIDKTKNVQTILFWIDFCLLSFAIMTSSLALSVAGYILLAVVYVVANFQRGLKKEIDRVVVGFLHKTQLLSSELTVDIERALAAERKLA